MPAIINLYSLSTLRCITVKNSITRTTDSKVSLYWHQSNLRCGEKSFSERFWSSNRLEEMFFKILRFQVLDLNIKKLASSVELTKLMVFILSEPYQSPQILISVLCFQLCPRGNATHSSSLSDVFLKHGSLWMFLLHIRLCLFVQVDIQLWEL